MAAASACRAGLARTFQVTKVFSDLTVVENVALGARLHLGRNLQMWHHAQSVADAQDRAYEVLDMLGLVEQAETSADHLAHGDKRILEIAIALALQPKVLLMDEPTAGMSQGETERIGALIRRIAKRSTVLLVEHDMEIVLGISDEITVMTQGRVIASGTPTPSAATLSSRMPISGPSTRGRCSAGAGGRPCPLRVGPRAARCGPGGTGGSDSVPGGTQRRGKEHDTQGNHGSRAA